MHELSIVQSVVTTVTEAFAGKQPGHIQSVRLRVGALSGVVEESLQFGYEIVTQGTILAGSRLDIQKLPVIIYCAPCDQLVELEGVQRFRCPQCGTPSGDIRQGRELEIESLEIEETDA